MNSSFFPLPQDISGCHAAIQQLLQEREQHLSVIQQQQERMAEQDEQIQQQAELINQLTQTMEQQQESIERLSADLKLCKRALFGSRRERFIDDPGQLYLFDTVALPDAGSDAPQDEVTAKPPSNRRKSKGRGRRMFPEFFARTPVYHKLNEEDIPEHLRGSDVQRFFKKTSEQLEFEPPTIRVLEHYQEVIAAQEESGETAMVTASKPPQLIDAYVGPGFLAYLTASRFADHLPYYRQEDITSRYGFRIARSTQWRWMFGLAQGVKPLVDRMRTLALQSRVLGVDETPVILLGGPTGSQKSYLWDTIGDDGYPYDCFYFTTDRSRDGPDQFLSGYRGYLQSDAYICYEVISKAIDEIIRVGCWAHSRRKFEAVNFTAPTKRTQMALAYIQRLYDIEDRGRHLSEEDRYQLRQREAKPIVAKFHKWLTEQYERELPKSKFREAIGYMTNRWDAFERYLECGAIPFDNNRTEAALKYAILGRNAWLFFGNEQGGETAAILFTLTKTCNRHHIDPYAYLRDVYTRLPTMSESDLDSLLPDVWIQEHPQHRIQERVVEAEARARRTRERREQRRKACA